MAWSNDRMALRRVECLGGIREFMGKARVLTLRVTQE